MSKKKKILLIVAAVLLAGLYYYVELPAINYHARGLWKFFLTIFIILLVWLIRRRAKRGEFTLGNGCRFRDEIKRHKEIRIILAVTLVVLAAYGIGSFLGSPIINAARYQKLLEVQEGDFAEEVEEASFTQIPLLDRDSSQILGNRKMGSLVDMVSQYEVDDIYSQINYQDRPVRVSPLRYASLIKWFTNRAEGIPAYIKIDMATQATSLVKLENGIKYSTCEHFGRNIYRHLRFRYPTYIFQDLSFEVDEEGTPHWIAPVSKFNIGLFGGETVGRVVICNAITGETKDYPLEEAPDWIDRANSADLLIRLYNYYGTLKHGYLNSVLGQRDCLQTSNGYNYLAIDDDIWVYTGVTSLSGDQSIVGFVLMNQRTRESRYYKVEGATEASAMASAEGEVQNLKYRATFPLLLNIDGQPTYFLALKDDAGLVKKYGMVNVQRYQWVAVGDTVEQCRADYQSLLLDNDIVQQEEAEPLPTETVTGRIETIAQAVLDGNTHFYLILEGSEKIYDVNVAYFIDVIRCKAGDEVTLEYETDGDIKKVVKFAYSEAD